MPFRIKTQDLDNLDKSADMVEDFFRMHFEYLRLMPIHLLQFPNLYDIVQVLIIFFSYKL